MLESKTIHDLSLYPLDLEDTALQAPQAGTMAWKEDRGEKEGYIMW